MKVSVQIELCVGHARCAALAPEIFGTDELEGKVLLLQADPSPGQEADAVRGARGCPERAIRITDDDGTVLWPPS